ncbi:MAG TPA: dihydropteroate synthase [Acidimicrobiales bacterium]|nr:dihydropteroate synthase [Acidimicrobiales bacterium]
MTTAVMGVVNVTPDSFFDGGRYFDAFAAIAHGEALVAEGADILDVGGESTRPGADPVDAAEELRRVIPVVTALARSVRVSIDTMKPSVAVAAIDAGATLVNDVAGTLAPVVAREGVGLVVMHMRGVPKTMQERPRYDDVVAEVHRWLDQAAKMARNLGVQEIYVDPGIGFGKTTAHNLALLSALPTLVATGEKVLVGTSRKAFLGALSASRPGEVASAEDRFEASVASAVYAMTCGVAMVRVHDVAACVDASRLVAATSGALSLAEILERAPLVEGAG